MTDDQIKHMVDRFLGWRLPENFSPDAGISFERTYNEHTPYPMKHEPIGTNLFDAQQAEQMVRYMVERMPCRPNPEMRPAEDGLAREPVAYRYKANEGKWGYSTEHVITDSEPLFRSPPLEPFERLVDEMRDMQTESSVYWADRLSAVIRGTKT